MSAPSVAVAAPPRTALRIGVDVGGTFTKAVAITTDHFELRAEAVVPTSHNHSDGVMAGVASALRILLGELDGERDLVRLVAFSTTQAMNALLEGDVPPVGVIGIGQKPDLRRARKRTKVGDIELAPGRSLRTVHEFLDTTEGLAAGAAAAAVDRLRAAGCGAVAISGAYSVDGPEIELEIAALAAEHAIPACCGHELSGAYGLEIRTVSAAINAAIIPVIERTAGLVEQALKAAGLDVPLLVLRGDGGAMDVESFRRCPSFTVGSGPAAGVAAALHRADANDAIVVEVGGTSTNVSLVSGGRPILRSIRVMGRPTAIRSIDSWVVGVAGGSMVRLGRRSIAATGPRSAHLAGFGYACFATPEELADATVELISPVVGDPAAYVTLVGGPDGQGGRRRYALTATCAANALGLVKPEAHAYGSRLAARIGFGRLADHLGRGDAGSHARDALDAALREIGTAVEAAIASHRIGPSVPILTLGGAGEALAPELARRFGRDLLRPEHQEVLASIGAAMTLVRAERSRSDSGGDAAARLDLIHQVERACVDAGAAPDTVTVEIRWDAEERMLRAIATGAVALEHGAAGRTPLPHSARRQAAARALRCERVEPVSLGEFYDLYRDGECPGGRIAVVDRLGSVPLTETCRSCFAGEGPEFESELRRQVADAVIHLGIASIIPRVVIVCGPRILDLSDLRSPEELAAAIERLLREHPGPAAAMVAR